MKLGTLLYDGNYSWILFVDVFWESRQGLTFSVFNYWLAFTVKTPVNKAVITGRAKMKIISAIGHGMQSGTASAYGREAPEVIKKILSHLGLCQ